MFHQEVPTSLLAYVTVTEAFIAQSSVCNIRSIYLYAEGERVVDTW